MGNKSQVIYGLKHEAYKNDLDNLDKLDIIQKLFAIAKQAEEQNATKQFKLRWGNKEVDVREKVEGFVGCLNKFKEIGDIVVQYNPVHVALPWAGVRFILMVRRPPSATPCNRTHLFINSIMACYWSAREIGSGYCCNGKDCYSNRPLCNLRAAVPQQQ